MPRSAFGLGRRIAVTLLVTDGTGNANDRNVELWIKKPQ
jgi:hypothetical protein